jgi:hypothetical protein
MLCVYNVFTFVITMYLQHERNFVKGFFKIFLPHAPRAQKPKAPRRPFHGVFSPMRRASRLVWRKNRLAAGIFLTFGE